MTAYYGVDFSGATDAGNRLWVACVRREGARLRLASCVPGRELPGGGRSREAALAALVALVGREPDAVFGMDFPFAPTADLLDAPDWVTFVRAFPRRFATPEAFRSWCRERTGGKEPKRRTDVLARVPFGSFNLRVYRQTFYGLRDLLSPLVTRDLARVLPMQPAASHLARVVEICPASTLQGEDLYRVEGRHRSYKDASLRPARAFLWRSLEARFGLVAPGALKARVLDDAGGDALDAVIAACATARAVEAGLPMDAESALVAPCEGFIYV